MNGKPRHPRLAALLTVIFSKAFVIYWSFETPRDAYLRSGVLDRMKLFTDRLLYFGSRTRWNRVLTVIE